MTDGQYGINTRYAPKVWDVGDDIVFTANGFGADCETLVKRIAQKTEVCNSRQKSLIASGITMHIIERSRFPHSLD